MASLRHVGDPRPDDLVRGSPVDPAPVEVDASGAGPQEAGDGAQQGGLAGAVRSDQRDDLSPLHLERDAVQRRQAAIAGDQVLDAQRRPVMRQGRPR